MRKEWTLQGFHPMRVQDLVSEEVIRTIILEAQESTVISTTALFLAALWDEYGFGMKRCSRVLERVSKLSSDIESGDISIEDLIEWCNEELGVIIK